MHYIKLESLPTFMFAHSYVTNDYRNTICSRENLIEISYICDGTLKCRNGDETVESKRNDVMCNLRLSDLKIESEGRHEHHTVCFAVPFTVSKEPQDGFSAFSLCTHAAENGEKILSVIDEIIRVSTINPNLKLTCTGLFLKLIDLVNECNAKDSALIRYSDYKYVEKAKKYIYTNLTSPIKQSDVATVLGITPEYLCSVFKKSEGMTLIKFINKIKLEKIKTLIKKENLKLHQAAEMYGYSDPNYVSRLYKKYFNKNITDEFD